MKVKPGNSEKARSGLAKTAFILLILGFTFYVLYHFINGYSSEVVTTEAKYTSAGVTDKAEAYIFRKETVLYSKYSGSVDYFVGDGELVRVETPLLDCYENTLHEDVNALRAELEADIAALKTVNIKGRVSITEADKIEKTAKELYYKLMSDLRVGNLTKATDNAEGLLSQLNKLSVFSGESPDFDEQIAKLKAEAESLSDMFTGDSDRLYSPFGGYFFREVDGYEDAFGVGDDAETYFSEMTLAGFNGIINQTAKNTTGAVGKISETYDWYIGVPVSRSFTLGYNEGEQYDVIFSGSETAVGMTLMRIIGEEGSNEAVMIFSCGNMPSDFRFIRHQEIKIQKRVYEGLYVPASAIRRNDGTDGVYVLYNMRIVFRTVDILYAEDGGYIVAEYDTTEDGKENMLRHNDSIIIKGKKLYDGRLIG